jgi:UDP-N-acetylmuramyl pentapeptide phosphotransferase/UDP-N-acetylglucosamine-1-phosphate transferase
MAASSLGFLIHNWPPARIFMGDVGSAFLGYTFAVLPLMLSYSEHNYDWRAAPLLGALFIWPFVFDSVFTLICRLFKGENVFSAHGSHLYQRLFRAGWRHRTISLTYIGLALTGVLTARVWAPGAATLSGSTILVVLLLCLGLWVGVIHQERRFASRSHAGLPT